MEITVDIKLDELLDSIKKLPAAKIKQLKSALDDRYIAEKAGEELSDFQDYLLAGPVMDTKQYDQFKKDRKYFSAWRQQ